jgi:adenine phosphoribosyltransferase
MDLIDHVRTVPDFPVPGILFYDVASLLEQPEVWRSVLDRLAAHLRAWEPEVIAGIESRGFLLAAPLAERLGVPMMMVRKAGKLPGETLRFEYDLEYGTDSIEIQTSALGAGQRVAIVDDLLATGGTLAASVALCRQAGADVVGCGVIIELPFLTGREKVAAPLVSLMTPHDG